MTLTEEKEGAEGAEFAGLGGEALEEELDLVLEVRDGGVSIVRVRGEGLMNDGL